MFGRKQFFRYYYWLIIEFFKKNGKLVIVSFFVSFIGIIGFLSLFPYIKEALNKEEIIGLVGNYSVNNPPDEIKTKISNGLVTVTEKGMIIPVIANSWEEREGGTIYRFHLKDGLLWSDGKKFSGNDIGYQFKDVTTKVVDDKTVDFVLKKKLAIFPTYLNRPLIKYPLLGVAGFYKTGKIITDQGSLKEVSLIPNIKDQIPLTYKFYNNESSLVNAYKKGEVTEITITKKSIADTFSNWGNTTIQKKVDYTKLLTIFINGKDALLSRKNVKDALSMAIDYKKLSEFGEIARGPIPPVSWAYNPNLKRAIFDQDNATQIIKKENDSTQSAKLNIVTYYDYYDVADIISQEFGAIGLNNGLNFSSFDQPNSFDLFIAYWKVPVDPDQYYSWHSTQIGLGKGNIGNYKDVKVDKYLEQGRESINLDDRQQNYFEFQKAIQDDPPAIFLYYPYVYTIKRK